METYVKGLEKAEDVLIKSLKVPSEYKAEDMCCIRLLNLYNCDYVIVDNLNQWYLCDDGDLNKIFPCTLQELDYFVTWHHGMHLWK